MNKILLIMALTCFFLSGCSLLGKLAPAQYDSQGKIIPGSRQPTDIVNTVADTIPYGQSALGIILLIAAGYEKYRSYKLEKGLKATLFAGKQVAADPELKEMWEKVRETYMRNAHETAGVTKLIKSILAKLPSKT